MIAVVLNAWSTWKLRVWNAGSEQMPRGEDAEAESIWGAEHDLAHPNAARPRPDLSAPEGIAAAQAGHVDARVRQVSQDSREVWDNPVLWREMCTWAYGRKVLVIRAAYLLLFALAAAGIYFTIESGAADLVAFGKSFLANPDLVERIRTNAPLNEPDAATFYGGGAKGYTDYPVLEPQTL